MTKNTKKAQTNIKKATTLITKVETMIENKECCLDVMQQNLTIIGLLKSAHYSMLEDTLNDCFFNEIDTKREKSKKIKKTMKFITENNF